MNISVNTNTDAEILARMKAHVFDIVGCCQEVHRSLGPWLNEYVYQDALKIAFEEKQIPYMKEYYFQVLFHGQPLSHKHYMDFLCKDDVAVECKAISSLGAEQRQQLWNYMRLSSTPYGILFNFAPVKDQCERYFYNKETGAITVF